MDNLECVLSVFLKKVPAQEILAGNISSADIKKDEFVQLMRSDTYRYSETELENLYFYLIYNFKEQFGEMEERKDKLDLFELIGYYSKWILTEQDNEIVCEYSKFLHWRTITNDLSEELFAASYFALRTLKNTAETIRFNWKAAITHNNWELHKILSQGLAENHSHLKGTSTVFPLTWISLMNNADSGMVYEQIEKIAQNRRKNSNSFCREKVSFPVQLLQAACIRFLLFKLVECVECADYIEYAKCPVWKKKVQGKLKKYCRWLKNPDRMADIKTGLMSDIYSTQNTFGGKPLPDYALVGPKKEHKSRNDETLIFQGERWLLYHFFYAIYAGTELKNYRELFYAYLVLKENFRSEFIQSNRDVGFENFRIYENRKDIFLENPFFKKEMVKKAIETSFTESKVMVMETRIAPKGSAKEYCAYIKQLDGWFDEKGKYRNRLFYTVHFIKTEDKKSGGEYISCRHNRKRQDYRKQAFALVEFRENYPKCASRIKGIDAANMEIGCGPEVFAQIFRYLSDHKIMMEMKSPKIPQLKKTYHVGEDFLDLVSGLRAIDETIHFLDMKCGDRLGHALALGVNPEEWYQSKNRRILLPQQEYLDNVAWMYHWVVTSRLENKGNILNFLAGEYEYYFQLIYKNAMKRDMLEHIRIKALNYYKGTEAEKYYNSGIYDFSIENYYSAWGLRGDAPELYTEGFFKKPEIAGNRYQSFSYYTINRNIPEQKNKRYIQNIALLYYYYHFDRNVRQEGEKTIEKRIDGQYMECVKMLQYEMQKKIAKSGIGIETNPSSNVLIGTFKRYDKHPILNFYNKDLVEDGEKLQKCPQISVSINTDDAGIFGTSLENEYAYMALALEKAKDENGNNLYKKRNVYEWLDHIRVMGLRQTFLDDEEMKKVMMEWENDHD